MSGRHNSGGSGPTPGQTGSAMPGPVYSFILFVVLGGAVTVLSAGLLSAFGLVDPRPIHLVAANAIITIGGTILCTEMHGRVTFRSSRRGLRMHAESALTALGAFLATSAAMLALRHFSPHPGILLDQGTYLLASGVAGGARFLLLRLVVFSTGRRPRGTGPDDRSAVVLAA